MAGKGNRTEQILAAAFGMIPTIWLALLAAPYMGGGLIGLLNGFANSMKQPFQIILCEDSPQAVLLFLFAYAMGLVLYWNMALHIGEILLKYAGDINKSRFQQTRFSHGM